MAAPDGCRTAGYDAIRWKLGYTDGVVGTGMLKSIRLGAAASAGAAASDQDVPVADIIASSPIVVFSSPGCPFCAQAVEALQAAGHEYELVQVSAAQRKDLLAATGVTSVPSVWVNGQYIGGMNDGPEQWMGVSRCLGSGKLQQLLDVPKSK